MRTTVLLLALLLGAPAMISAQRYVSPDGKLRVALVKMAYTGSRNAPDRSTNPDYLQAGGIEGVLEGEGAHLRPTHDVRLTVEDEGEYGEWNRLSLANGHLAEVVAENERNGYLTIGLLGNCNALMGMLGGLQHSGPTRRPLKVGLVWIDAHGDFNTPETTLSGMLGGMPVAVSAGLALHNIRRKSGLDPALPTRYIVMVGVRDTDPLEQELIDRSDIEMITVEEVRSLSDHLHRQMERLSSLTDIIYVHVDMDVLDPEEVQGHSLNVPDGPTSTDLAAAIAEMFRYEKVAALGIASTPSGERDPEGLSRQGAYRLILGAIEGVRGRR